MHWYSFQLTLINCSPDDLRAMETAKAIVSTFNSSLFFVKNAAKINFILKFQKLTLLGKFASKSSQTNNSIS